jgi:hypothetical protein
MSKNKKMNLTLTNFLNLQIEKPYFFSTCRLILKIISFLGYYSLIIFIQAKLAKNYQNTGLSPEYLGWFVYSSFFSITFVAFGFLGTLAISGFIDVAIAFFKKVKK